MCLGILFCYRMFRVLVEIPLCGEEGTVLQIVKHEMAIVSLHLVVAYMLLSMRTCVEFSRRASMFCVEFLGTL